MHTASILVLLSHTALPSLPPPLVAVSHDFCSHGFKRCQGWTDQRTAGLVFSVSPVNEPGPFLLHAPTSAEPERYSWNVYNLLQNMIFKWGVVVAWSQFSYLICLLLQKFLSWDICASCLRHTVQYVVFFFFFYLRFHLLPSKAEHMSVFCSNVSVSRTTPPS